MTSTITFRRMTRDDFPMVVEWLARPHVDRWWNENRSLDEMEDEYGDGIDGNEVFDVYIVSRAAEDGDEVPFGFVQVYPVHDYDEYVAEFEGVYPVDESAWSIDYFIADNDLTGKGLGRAMIRAFTNEVWQKYPQPGCLVVPVNSSNRASWKMLIGAGFALVAEGEMEPDNPIDDRAHHILRLDRPD